MNNPDRSYIKGYRDMPGGGASGAEPCTPDAPRTPGAPRSQERGGIRSPEGKCRANSLRPKMWQAMRVAYKSEGTFTVGRLAALTGASPSAVLTFLKALEGVGVVMRMEGAGEVRHTFVRDLGPAAPVVRRVFTVFDPNSGKELKRYNNKAKEAK